SGPRRSGADCTRGRSPRPWPTPCRTPRPRPGSCIPPVTVMNEQTLFLEAADVRTLVRRVGIDRLMDHLIARLTEAVWAFEPAVMQVPPRSGIAYERPVWGLLECMPAHVDDAGT